MDVYQIATIIDIRKFGSRLNMKSDESIADMYHQWSEMTSSARWRFSDEETVTEFIKWATTCPCDEYDDT